MKLTIERLNTLTQEDCRDLAKIWPEQTESDWQSWLAQGNMLFAARFNERLLGALKVSMQADVATLHDISVREVTRRRGVGLYLVDDTRRQLPEINAWHFTPGKLEPVQHEALAGFMAACGFSAQGDSWSRR